MGLIDKMAEFLAGKEKPKKRLSDKELRDKLIENADKFSDTEIQEMRWNAIIFSNARYVSLVLITLAVFILFFIEGKKTQGISLAIIGVLLIIISIFKISAKTELKNKIRQEKPK